MEGHEIGHLVPELADFALELDLLGEGAYGRDDKAQEDRQQQHEG
jgi:hypothetical protein